VELATVSARDGTTALTLTDSTGVVAFSTAPSLAKGFTSAGATYITTFVTLTGPVTYTVQATDHTFLIDASSGAVTINLPAAASSTGRELRFKNTTAPGVNAITYDANSTELIDGAETYTAANQQYDALTLLCTGAAWAIF
jgi:hypothetical protein